MPPVRDPNTVPPYVYDVPCHSHGIAKYMEKGLDFVKCNALAKKLYKDMATMLLDADSTYSNDEALIVLAMLVRQHAHRLDHDPYNGIDFERDVFPELCSLIGPDSGFGLQGHIVGVQTPEVPNAR